MNLHHELLAILRAGMAAQDLNQWRLAKLSGVAQGNLSAIMSGRPASEATWQRLFDVTHPPPAAPAALASEGTLAAKARIARDCKHGVPVPGHCRNCGMTKRTMADGTTVPNL